MRTSPVTFIVPGTSAKTRGRAEQPPPRTPERGVLKQSIRVSTRRGDGEEVPTTAEPGRDVVILRIQNGPALTLHPENARDLLAAQLHPDGRPVTRGARGRGTVRVPTRLQWEGPQTVTAAPGLAARSAGSAARGDFADVILSGIDIVSGAAQELIADKAIGAAQRWLVSQLVSRVDAQVDEGVYQLEPARLTSLKARGQAVSRVPTSRDPVLVLVHGTFSTTEGTFSRLWTTHADDVRRIFQHYGDRVFALEHRTLGVSPIENALTLATALPDGAQVHLLTHSRGGLVGDVLARACSVGAGAGVRSVLSDVHAGDRRQLQELMRIVGKKRIRVTRSVRVACPARGTLLASRRLDAYLSVFRWTLELAGLPVGAALVDFLYGVAQHRTDPLSIPGLAAMTPDSALIRWLHSVDRPVEGDLRVIAGDTQADSLSSWLKTLLADSFFWTDNDLVVQTRSMYGGSPRGGGQAMFALDRGGTVTHFNYFNNSRSVQAIVDGLVEATPPAFAPIGPQSYGGRDASGTRAARAGRPTHGRSTTPAVILVPGVFGSGLVANGHRVWPDSAVGGPVERLRFGPARVSVDGLVDSLYGELAQFLGETFDVIPFAYDWRRPLLESASLLARELAAALARRRTSGAPVRIVAHSTGGLIVRAVQLARDEVWRAWLSQAESRLLLLGAPTAGFWAPMQLMSGDETLSGALTLGSLPGREGHARQAFATFPGVVQLQAGLLDKTLKLSRRATWMRLATADARAVLDVSRWHDAKAQRDVAEWGIPSQRLLDDAVRLHKRLHAQRRRVLSALAGRAAVVLGRDHVTPIGYEQTPSGMVYRYTTDGDGSISDENALLDDAPAWRVDISHSHLTRSTESFAAYRQLLETGQTERLPLARVHRDRGETLVRDRPSRRRWSVAPPVSMGTPLGVRQELVGPPQTQSNVVRVTVVNGDLTFIRQPLLIGHYRSSKLTGGERVTDRLIGGTMGAALDKGQYPDAPGSHQVFGNTRVRPDDPTLTPCPEAVIVVGLGEEGKLRPADLVRTVQHGVMAWAQRLRERHTPPRTFELATVLIGSGGIGMSVGQSAQLIVQGVREANERLTGGYDPTATNDNQAWPLASHVRLVELYHDRATEAWRALRMMLSEPDSGCVLTDTVGTLPGALPRPIDASYRGANYDFIRAETLDGSLDRGIAYTLDTRRARAEAHPQPIQLALLHSLIRQGASDRNRDDLVGRTLFRLLVPVDMEPFLTGDTEAQLEVDSGTAGIPWELLDTRNEARHIRTPEPWAIRTKLLRKLRTTEFRGRVVDAGHDAPVLVVGEPKCDEARYPRLPGARTEARAVAKSLTTGARALPTSMVRLLVSEGAAPGPDANTVVKTLLARDWRILHIAGHGDLPELADDQAHRPSARIVNPRGVVLSGGAFIGAREINSMRTVPELVFLNCCHLAARQPEELLATRRSAFRRSEFAAGVADALIKLGVRCVIAAGWAVEDDQACLFAQRFYEALLAGQRFIDAVATARRAAWKAGGNTWGAYQCYGDPDWTLQPRALGGGGAIASVRERFAVIASPRDLEIALETLAVEARSHAAAHSAEAGARTTSPQWEAIELLRQRFEHTWGTRGKVAEAFAVAYAEVDAFQEAVRWYSQALEANDGGASVRAVEQLANMRIRLAWEAAWRPSARATHIVKEANRAIAREIGTLEKLVAIAPTSERLSLLGAASKRQVMLARVLGDANGEQSALTAMLKFYEAAATLARNQRADDVHYPALNHLAAKLLSAPGPEPVRLHSKEVDDIRSRLEAIAGERPDFWSWVSQTELALYESMARRTLAKDVSSVIAGYDRLKLRVSSTWLWASVLDQARFVLHAYGVDGLPDERAAADSLIAYLQKNARAEDDATDEVSADGPRGESTRSPRRGRAERRPSSGASARPSRARTSRSR